MKRALPLVLFAQIFLTCAQSGEAQTPAGVEPGKKPQQEVVELSPFTVSTDKDNGFAATSAMSGGRLAGDLRDTPAAYSVITRDFIDTLNLTDLMAAQNWSTGSTYQSDIGTFNFTSFTVRYNARGVSAGQQLRNFFPMNGDNDSYVLERFDFGRGANSILFGNGSLGGVSSSTSKRARTDKTFQDAKLTAGSWNMMRATIDVNQAVNEKVAVRIAAVGQDGDGWRQKEFDRRKGVFGTVTARPFRNTEIHVEAEAVARKVNQPINNLQDQLSGWDGKTTFSAPAALASATSAQLTSLQASGVGRRAANYNVYDPYNAVGAIVNFANEPTTLGGGTTASTPIAGFVSGTAPAFGLANANAVLAQNVPVNRFDIAEANSKFRRPSRRFSINPNGPLLASTFHDFQASIQQRLGDFYIELAGDINKNANHTNGEENRGANATYIDINRVLPNGQQNPHFLQAYGDGNIFRGVRHYDYHNSRLALAYKKDTSWAKFTFNTMLGANSNHYTISYQWLSLAQGTDMFAWIRSTTADIKIRRYWNEPNRPFIDLAGKPIAYLDPVTNTSTTVTPRWKIDFSTPTAESVNDADYRYGFVAMNAKFWNDRVILLAAERRDGYFSNTQQVVAAGDYPHDRDPLKALFKPNAPRDWDTLTYVPLSTSGSPLSPAPATVRPRLSDGSRDPRYTQYRFQDDYNAPSLRGYVNTKSMGTVVHLTNWFSPSVNYAETFNPQKAYALQQGGGIVAPTVSTGWDYGARFEFFERKLDVNVTYYRSKEINNPVTVSGLAFNTILQAIPVGGSTAGNKRGLANFISGSDLQTRQANGYEMEIVANLSKGFRLMANAALPYVYGVDGYRLTRAYIAANGATVKQIAEDAGATIDANNVASVNPAIPLAQQSPNVQAVVDAYNQIYTSYKNLNMAKGLQLYQPLFKVFGDYTIQSGKMRGVRLGLGVQYRGREVLGNRGADTIVDPSNSSRAIDDPARTVNTPILSPKGDYTVTATFGYRWRVMNRDVQLQLVVNNLLNDQSVIWTTSTNGTATTALRPRDGNYSSPARETVPVGFGLKTPINFNFSASLRL